MCLWSPDLHWRHICSSRYDWRSSLFIPRRIFWPSLRLFQQDSISCVWNPVTGSTKWRVSTTTLWSATLLIRTVMHLYISRPVIHVYNCPRSDASGDDGIKSGNVASIDNLEVTSRRGEFRYDYSKNPRVSGSSSSPVILKMLHMIIITQLNSLVTKVNLYPYCIVSWICCFCWICCLSAFAEFVALRA